MPIEIKASGHVCRRCGNSYGKLSGNFLVCYGALYKGAGYLPYCNHCVEDMYMSYLRQCGDQQAALRQLCRKLDLYWSAELYESILAKTTPANIVKDYIAKLRGKNCIGKSFESRTDSRSCTRKKLHAIVLRGRSMQTRMMNPC